MDPEQRQTAVLAAIDQHIQFQQHLIDHASAKAGQGRRHRPG
jgi:hypothetical protein